VLPEQEPKLARGEVRVTIRGLNLHVSVVVNVKKATGPLAQRVPVPRAALGDGRGLGFGTQRSNFAAKAVHLSLLVSAIEVRPTLVAALERAGKSLINVDGHCDCPLFTSGVNSNNLNFE
jgi:hypothetical protein